MSGEESEARIAELERRVRALEIVLGTVCEMEAVWRSPPMWPALELLGYDKEQMAATAKRKRA